MTGTKPRDVFISHASKDGALARGLCETLEKSGASCWVAYRDIPPGGRYPVDIRLAIENAKVFLLVFSDSATKSDDVLSEVSIAFRRKKPIIPFRVENIELGERFEYFLSLAQWVDGFPDAETHYDVVARSVATALQRPLSSPAPQPQWWWRNRRRIAQVAAAMVILFGLWELGTFLDVGSAPLNVIPQITDLKPTDTTKLDQPNAPVGQGSADGSKTSSGATQSGSNATTLTGQSPPPVQPAPRRLSGVTVRIIHVESSVTLATTIRDRLLSEGAFVELRPERDIPSDRANSIVYLANQLEEATLIQTLVKDIKDLKLTTPTYPKQDSSIVVWLPDS